ncbi:hypothetical protein LIER_27865 [Lithospermum erythrorhizon]|uniref:Tf2-1-like SH3-like domain-containing protein n=1 Tax=Lithospermum erythrorhizon TaxID=34254 RepID=A0AAV3RF45_LITER
MAPDEALYGRKCRSHVYWHEVGENYADVRRSDLDVKVGDHVFLKVPPVKFLKRFGMEEKLRSRYVGPFEILEKVGNLAYRVALPPTLSKVHDVFHVSMLRKYAYDTVRRLF